MSYNTALYADTEKQSMEFFPSIGRAFTHDLGLCRCDLHRVVSLLFLILYCLEHVVPENVSKFMMEFDKPCVQMKFLHYSAGNLHA